MLLDFAQKHINLKYEVRDRQFGVCVHSNTFDIIENTLFLHYFLRRNAYNLKCILVHLAHIIQT